LGTTRSNDAALAAIAEVDVPGDVLRLFSAFFSPDFWGVRSSEILL
jgi:hypothetical protein